MCVCVGLCFQHADIAVCIGVRMCAFCASLYPGVVFPETVSADSKEKAETQSHDSLGVSAGLLSGDE